MFFGFTCAAHLGNQPDTPTILLGRHADLCAGLDEEIDNFVPAPETRHMQSRLSDSIGGRWVEPFGEQLLQILNLAALALCQSTTIRWR